MLFDLQVHSRLGSADSAISPADLVSASVAASLDGVALTEHAPADFREARDLFDEAGLVLVPGREVACGGVHLLVLSHDEDFLRDLPRLVSPSDPQLRRDDIACIWAHPAAPSGSSAYPPARAFVPAELRDVVHAVEVLNGRHLHFVEAIEAATALAADLGAGVTAGSDAHRPEEIGRCVSEVDAAEGEGTSGVIAAIRASRTQPVLLRKWAVNRGVDYRDSLRTYLR